MATKKIRSANAASMSALAPDLPRTDKLKDGSLYTLSLVHAERLSPSEKDTIYTIFDENMSYLQQSSSFPYTESSKREELFHPDTRYLLVRTPPKRESTATANAIAPSGSAPASGSRPSEDINARASTSTLTASITETILSPLVSLATNRSRADTKSNIRREGEEGDPILGYCSFRFDTEETLSPRDAEVVYCYELQLSPSLRGQGLGKILISHLEDIGRRRGMDKSMLTCLKGNTDALSFYTKQGYQPDEIDPTRMAEEEEWTDGDEEENQEDQSEDEVDYVILSKNLKTGLR
ncbi:hypothetical protein IAU59_003743 [Kwoniella sp. CBS 9459]